MKLTLVDLKPEVSNQEGTMFRAYAIAIVKDESGLTFEIKSHGETQMLGNDGFNYEELTLCINRQKEQITEFLLAINTSSVDISAILI